MSSALTGQGGENAKKRDSFDPLCRCRLFSQAENTGSLEAVPFSAYPYSLAIKNERVGIPDSVEMKFEVVKSCADFSPND
jgi:hypothetical protein